MKVCKGRCSLSNILCCLSECTVDQTSSCIPMYCKLYITALCKGRYKILQLFLACSSLTKSTVYSLRLVLVFQFGKFLALLLTHSSEGFLSLTSSVLTSLFVFTNIIIRQYISVIQYLLLYLNCIPYFIVLLNPAKIREPHREVYFFTNSTTHYFKT